MVELRSWNGMANDDASSIEQEVRGETSASVIANISAELQEEKQRNAELMERISELEAVIQEQETTVASLKRRRRRRSEVNNGGLAKAEARGPRGDRLVNWIHMDEGQCLQGDHKLKDKDDCFDGECDCDDDTEESNGDDDDGVNYEEIDTNGGQTKPSFSCVKQELSDFGVCVKSTLKKPTKVAFCPKEVRKILKSESLLAKNAECHTIRKILVFACLGIRHGCDDMFGLDFTHFSIVKKGELEEYVVYENPGARQRKMMFYRNGENSTLCPVQILEEEKAMRPCDDDSCPSCLFLCIKYGGRTRNLPQNEYVRQRMGRNKLKSFGPLICRMANLANMRSGSFFFKALGITTLFMAGFPHHLVQRETLDLTGKYYRTDEDASEEELFLSNLMVDENQASSDFELPGKPTSKKKHKGQKKPPNPTRKPPTSSKSHVPNSNKSPAQTTTADGPTIPLPIGPNQRPINPYPFPPPTMYFWSPPPPAAPHNAFLPFAYPFFPPPPNFVSSMNDEPPSLLRPSARRRRGKLDDRGRGRDEWYYFYHCNGRRRRRAEWLFW